MKMEKSIKLLFTLGLILIGRYTYSQPLELDTHHKKLADFLQLENSLGSLRLEDKSNYISGEGVAQPVEFKRKEKGIPDLLVNYFYYKKDSAIDYILYEWDEKNFNRGQENTQLSSTEINALINKYKYLYNRVVQRFGKSDSTGSLTDLSKIKTGDFKREDTWKPDDSTSLNLYIVLSSKYEKNGPVTIDPTYLIRLYIKTLPKEAEESGFEKPDENKVKQLDSVLQAFMSFLKSNELGQARSFLSDRIAGQVTDEQLTGLKQSIRLGDTLVVFFSGFQIGQDGSKYLMLHYKYATDKTSPPQEMMLGVLFDEKNKILIIRPMIRQ
jgi:hypothetical protein